MIFITAHNLKHISMRFEFGV